MIERMYYYGTDTEGNVKSIRGQPEIQQHTEIMDTMKEMFRDVLQQVMESELDTEFGYEKSQRTSERAVESKPRNYRSGHSKKTVRTQLGAVEVKVPRDRNGEYEPQIIGKYSRNADGMEEKFLGLYACGTSQSRSRVCTMWTSRRSW